MKSSKFNDRELNMRNDSLFDLICCFPFFLNRNNVEQQSGFEGGEMLESKIFVRNEEKRRAVYRPFLRQCVRTQPNEQAATHGADKKEENLPSLSLPLYSVPSSITSGTRWGRWRYVEDRRRGGQARWVASEQDTAGWRAVVREGAHRRVGQERV